MVAARGTGASGYVPPGAGGPGQQRLEDMSPEEQERFVKQMRESGITPPGQMGPQGPGQPGQGQLGGQMQPAPPQQPKPAAPPKPKKKPELHLEELLMPISEDVKSLDLWWVNWSQSFNYPQLAQYFKVSGLPTLMFIDADGKPYQPIPGFKPKDEFAKMLDSVLAEFNKVN